MSEVIATGWKGGDYKLDKRSPKKDVIKHIEQLNEREGFGFDPIRVAMEVAMGARRVQKENTRGDNPADFMWVNDLVGGYDKQGNPMQVDAATRLKAAAELLQYMAPKLKSVEVTGADGTPISFSVVADHGPLPGDKIPITIEAEISDQACLPAMNEMPSDMPTEVVVPMNSTPATDPFTE